MFFVYFKFRFSIPLRFMVEEYRGMRNIQNKEVCIGSCITPIWSEVYLSELNGCVYNCVRSVAYSSVIDLR